MSRRLVAWGWCVGLAVVGAGCTPTAHERDLDFELRKTQADRDAAQQRLAAEQAKTAALHDELRNEQEQCGATRVQAAALSSEVARLHERNDELTKALEEVRDRPVARPAVAESPLPEEADQALAAYAGRLPDRVWYDRGRAALSFANDRLFESGSDQVRSDAQAMLQELAGALAKVPADRFEIIVVGHTDDAPITKAETKQVHATNWHLSVHRAIAVREALSAGGVPAERFAVMGYGPYRPVGDDRAKNRRVEIFVVPKGGTQALGPVKAGKR